ncbi:MAG: PTS glucose transporter subunit IIA [Coriobacteriaceae bacterium]|nr:PTS glucose transporter subunit IIA [Coriobacteriaceae bacterium]
MLDGLMMPFLRRQRDLVLAAPLAGAVVPLTSVRDETFSTGILGTGVAIQPAGERVVAPANAKIEAIFPTGHAVALHTEDGLDILIHLGLDTVGLRGKHFKVHARPGETVERGAVLIEFERAQIEAEGYDTIVPVLVRNALEFSSLTPTEKRRVSELDDLIYVRGR